MKKILATALLAFGMIAANAQQTVIVTEPDKVKIKTDTDRDHDWYPVYIGIRYMPTFIDLDYGQTDNGVISTSFVLGHGFGALVGFNLGNHVGIQGEVIYSTLAQKYKEQNSQIERQVRLNYVNVPVMLVLNTGFGSPVNFHIEGGPQVGFNAGAKIESTDNPNNTETVNAVFAVKKSDFGVAYGAGIDFGTAVKLSLGFRGVYGLVDISDRSHNLTTNEYYVLDRSHVRTYAGYAGLTFAF